MEIEHRLSRLERQNRLFKLAVALMSILTVVVYSMGAASFNQERGELLNITAIQVIDSHGTVVGTIDASEINFSNKESKLIANKVIGRRGIAANLSPDGDQRYAELGVTADKQCYLELKNNSAIYHSTLANSGILDTNF
jgi:hypothetical protein